MPHMGLMHAVVEGRLLAILLGAGSAFLLPTACNTALALLRTRRDNLLESVASESQEWVDMAWAFAQLACLSEGLGLCAAGLTSDPTLLDGGGAHEVLPASPRRVEAGACAPTSG